jgi:hypothetical protein
MHARSETIWTHDNVLVARQSLCLCNIGNHTAKSSLPSKSLPCDICRAASHDEDFAVHIVLFAVQFVERQHAVFP